MGLSTISLSNPSRVRSIVTNRPSKISSAIALPTAGACWIPTSTSISLFHHSSPNPHTMPTKPSGKIHIKVIRMRPNYTVLIVTIVIVEPAPSSSHLKQSTIQNLLCNQLGSSTFTASNAETLLASKGHIFSSKYVWSTSMLSHRGSSSGGGDRPQMNDPPRHSLRKYMPEKSHVSGVLMPGGMCGQLKLYTYRFL